MAVAGIPDFLNGLFFSEILADNAGGGAVNVNGQGGANKQDEFVEIQNNSGSAINLSGYQIWSNKNGLLHSFGANDQIAPGETATVVGTYTNPPSNSGFYGANGNNNSASGNGGFLEDGEGNKDDTIYLVAPDGNYIQLSYGSPPSPPAVLPPGFPPGGSLQGAGEALNTGAPNGTSILRDADGNLVEGTPTPDTSGPVCFASGTLIATDRGDVVVDDLKPGDLVRSKDHGLSTLRAIRKSHIGRVVLGWNPHVRAVVVPTGVLGNCKPLRLSPAHRVLIDSPSCEMLFASSEVFVSARQLVGHHGIFVDMSNAPLTYFHLLFDTHEIIQSDGSWTESLFLGDTAHAAIQATSGWRMDETIALERMHHTHTARPVLKAYEVALLIDYLEAADPSGLLVAA